MSSQHAVVRWVGNGWEVVDRGSRNGTRLNGANVEPGRAYRLAKGALLTFGHVNESWTLYDTSEPRVAAFDLDSGKVHSEQLGLIGIPTSEQPECTLLLADAMWQLEDAEGARRAIVDGDTFEVGGRRYLFSCPSTSGSTLTAGAELESDRASPTLCFVVSSDEDFVALSLKYAGRTVELGSRNHNYLLLTLARRRLADQADAVPSASSGWVDKDELARGLLMAPQQIDGEIFRIRKHFASHGIPEAALIIERRARTRQIRLGFERLSVTRG